MTDIHCSFNPRMRCYDLPLCPFRDERFKDLLDTWVFTGRECPSLNWQRGGPLNTKVAESVVLRKCEMTRLFDYPERVQWFVANGGMSRDICNDIKRGYFLWQWIQPLPGQDGDSLHFRIKHNLWAGKRRWEKRHDNR